VTGSLCTKGARALNQGVLVILKYSTPPPLVWFHLHPSRPLISRERTSALHKRCGLDGWYHGGLGGGLGGEI